MLTRPLAVTPLPKTADVARASSRRTAPPNSG